MVLILNMMSPTFGKSLHEWGQLRQSRCKVEFADHSSVIATYLGDLGKTSL